MLGAFRLRGPVIAAAAAMSLYGGEAGVKPAEIVIGQCAALTGPTAGLGIGMQAGMKAAFDEVNSKGGVHGRQIRFVSADDGYEPEKCVECTSKLIEDEQVFALAGYVGTPTAKVAVPMVQELKVPLIGIFSGAMLLREPVQRYVFNVRASYDDETETLIEYLSSKLGLKKIAVFYQNDSFGQSGLSGTEKALAKRKLTLVSKGTFERNTLAVKSGLAAVMAGDPQAVIIVGPYKPTAEFIRQARATGLKSLFATISFVGTENLIAELGPESDDLVISQVVPSPVDDKLPLTSAYQAAMKKSLSSATPSYVSFEGYIAGRVIIAALDRAGTDLSREKLINALDGISKLDLDGMPISFSNSNHQASNLVFLTRVKAGKASAILSN